MKEEDIIKELFSKTELNYPIEGIEETILKKIEIKSAYQKKIQVYNLIGKIGFLFFIILCILFIMIIGEADPAYLFLGSPFILILLMFPLEILFNKKTIKQT